VQDQLILNDTQRADFEALKAYVLRKTGIDLNLYKAQQMHRRLMGLVERANLKSFSDYLKLLDCQPEEMATFLDRMTINVSELFRNADKWTEMREKVLPRMLKERRPLRVWSAGCSFGAEPYTIAMILDDLAPGMKHYILATDIDQKILDKARRGVFTEPDVKNVPDAYRRKHIEAKGDEYCVTAGLRDRIAFRRHNLLRDPFEHDFDLICCRNVVIYFTDEAKDELFKRFCQALRPSGTLFIGGTERIFNYREIGMDTKIPFFYERVS